MLSQLPHDDEKEEDLVERQRDHIGLPSRTSASLAVYFFLRDNNIFLQ